MPWKDGQKLVLTIIKVLWFRVVRLAHNCKLDLIKLLAFDLGEIR